MTVSIKRILLAYDFYDSTQHALNWAAMFAKALDAELLLVHSVEYMPYHYGFNYWHIIYDVIKPRVDDVCQDLRNRGVNVLPAVIKEGRSYDTILAGAVHHNADFIIIGAGKKRIADHLLGTTATRIVRNAVIPVCVIRDEPEPDRIKRIMCAVDFSVASMRVMATALELARGLRAQLLIYHVAPKSTRYPGLESCTIDVIDYQPQISAEDKQVDIGDLEAKMRRRTEKAFHDYLKDFDLTDIPHKTIMGFGQPETEIIKESERYNVDLLVMGTVGQSGLSRFLIGNIAEKVMRDVNCSLVTVNHQGVPPRSEKPSSENGTSGKSLTTAPLPSRVLDHHYRTGRQLLAQGKAREAISEFLKCIEIDVRCYGAYDLCSLAYAQLGDETQSVNYSQESDRHRQSVQQAAPREVDQS